MPIATILTIFIFVIGYVAIAFEHSLKLDKAASALITGVLCWTLVIIQSPDTAAASESLMHHLGEIASILFFLLGAMAIVQLIDSYDGFDLITQKISARSKRSLLIIISAITFFMSAALDNLTTSIVMMSLCTQLLSEREDRLWFAGLIVISANAGGAWSPLGDVTTTMLWIGGQITAANIIQRLILPSLLVCLLPTLIIAWRFRGQRFSAPAQPVTTAVARRKGRIILFSGLGLLLFVPVFKTLTHLPPFMGMMLALGTMWVITTIINKKRSPGTDDADHNIVAKALQRVDAPSILFFLGILLAVSALQTNGVLTSMAGALGKALKNDYLVGTALGLLSAVVDNVPLVAAAQGMYSLQQYPTDHVFWEFLALTTGTGGSAIIIGSAAGVAIMGIEQIKFGWYLRRISWLALVGFAAGIIFYVAEQTLF
jgi:Na+/H+ antiporter NhaD/arsenite permease-like protein